MQLAFVPSPPLPSPLLPSPPLPSPPLPPARGHAGPGACPELHRSGCHCSAWQGQGGAFQRPSALGRHPTDCRGSGPTSHSKVGHSGEGVELCYSLPPSLPPSPPSPPPVCVCVRTLQWCIKRDIPLQRHCDLQNCHWLATAHSDYQGSMTGSCGPRPPPPAV